LGTGGLDEGCRGGLVESAGTGGKSLDETNSILPKAICADIPSHVTLEGQPRVPKGDGGQVPVFGPFDDKNGEWASALGPPVDGCVNSIGPSVLRTKNGDIPLLSPTHSNPFLEDFGGVNDNEPRSIIVSAPQMNTLPLFTASGTRKKEKDRARRALPKKHQNPPKSNLVLPPGKLLKFPGILHGYNNPPKRRKQPPKGPNAAPLGVEVESDSIQCPDDASFNLIESTQLSVAPDLGGIGLEVVLPFPVMDSSRDPGLILSINASGNPFHDQSGVLAMIDNPELLNEDTGSVDRTCISREESEARRLMVIQEALGVTFHGNDGEDLQRGLQHEIRDKQLKDDWVRQNSYQ
jgi:hypothetical protein